MAWLKKFSQGVLERFTAGFLLWVVTTLVPAGAVVGAVVFWWERINDVHPFYLVVGCIVAMVCVQWMMVGAVYWRRIRRIGAAENLIVSVRDIVPHVPYNSAWETWDVLALWQIACLWAGEEPYLPIAHGTKPYPHLKILEGAIILESLPVIDRSNDEMAWWTVRRDALIEYINKRGFSPRPAFLFPNG